MPARGRVRGLQKLPKPGGYHTWYWSASQLSRSSEGFYPRSVRLWHGVGEPAPTELAEIEARAHQLSLDLQDWLVKPARKVRSKRGFIYFIRAAENVKIGFSRDTKRRMAELQTFFPFPLEMLGSIPGSTLTERQMHHRFRSLRVNGEWFRHSSEIDGFLEKNRTGGTSEPPVRIANPVCQNRSQKKQEIQRRENSA